jgi:RNA polymerase sigma-70 factor (ECF subfamily)
MSARAATTILDHSRPLGCPAVGEEADLVARLQAGEEAAFVALVRMYQRSLLRLAESVVSSRSVAEEVVQDTWLAVVRGVDRFEGRSSFKTWLFHILMNRARTTAGREHRVGSLPDGDLDDRFDATGAWAQPPVPWADLVDDRLVADHLAKRVRAILPMLPETQREVVVLRDIEGLPPADVCAVLGVTDGNMRVLLHRARAHIREQLALEMGTA